MTGISRDGKMNISTIWKRINNKKKETLQGTVKKHTVDSKRSLVMTDCLKAYKGLSDYLNHKTVNHSREGRYRFVTEDGIHANNAESCHSAIKRAIRRQGRLSMLPEEAEKTISLYTLWFKKPSWQLRRKALLIALKEAKDLDLTEVEMSSDEEPDSEFIVGQRSAHNMEVDDNEFSSGYESETITLIERLLDTSL